MCRALAESATASVNLLWQAALTASTRGHLCSKMSDLAILCIKHSERIKGEASLGADPFTVFARLCSTALMEKSALRVSEQLLHLQANLVKFNGALINNTMFHAARVIHASLDERCRSELGAIERAHGKDILSTKYQPLYKIVLATSKEAAP